MIGLDETKPTEGTTSHSLEVSCDLVLCDRNMQDGLAAGEATERRSLPVGRYTEVELGVSTASECTRVQWGSVEVRRWTWAKLSALCSKRMDASPARRCHMQILDPYDGQRA